MQLPELKPEEPKSSWIISALAGAAIFFIFSLARIGLFEKSNVGHFFNASIGFFIGWAFDRFTVEIKKQNKILKRDNQLLFNYQKAEEKYKNKNYLGAVDEYQEALKIEFTNASVHFNLACLYSLIKNKDKGYVHLKYASKFNYPDLNNKIMENPDLKYLRDDLDFDDFLDKWIKKKKT
jgi:hypothetical protein